MKKLLTDFFDSNKEISNQKSLDEIFLNDDTKEVIKKHSNFIRDIVFFELNRKKQEIPEKIKNFLENYKSPNFNKLADIHTKMILSNSFDDLSLNEKQAILKINRKETNAIFSYLWACKEIQNLELQKNEEKMLSAYFAYKNCISLDVYQEFMDNSSKSIISELFDIGVDMNMIENITESDFLKAQKVLDDLGPNKNKNNLKFVNNSDYKEGFIQKIKSLIPKELLRKSSLILEKLLRKSSPALILLLLLIAINIKTVKAETNNKIISTKKIISNNYVKNVVAKIHNENGLKEDPRIPQELKAVGEKYNVKFEIMFPNGKNEKIITKKDLNDKRDECQALYDKYLIILKSKYRNSLQNEYNAFASQNGVSKQDKKKKLNELNNKFSSYNPNDTNEAKDFLRKVQIKFDVYENYYYDLKKIARSKSDFIKHETDIKGPQETYRSIRSNRLKQLFKYDEKKDGDWLSFKEKNKKEIGNFSKQDLILKNYFNDYQELERKIRIVNSPEYEKLLKDHKKTNELITEKLKEASFIIDRLFSQFPQEDKDILNVINTIKFYWENPNEKGLSSEMTMSNIDFTLSINMRSLLDNYSLDKEKISYLLHEFAHLKEKLIFYKEEQEVFHGELKREDTLFARWKAIPGKEKAPEIIEEYYVWKEDILSEIQKNKKQIQEVHDQIKGLKAKNCHTNSEDKDLKSLKEKLVNLQENKRILEIILKPVNKRSKKEIQKLKNMPSEIIALLGDLFDVPKDGYVQPYARNEYPITLLMLRGRLDKLVSFEHIATFINRYFENPETFKSEIYEAKNSDGSYKYPKTRAYVHLLKEYSFLPENL